MKAWLMKFGFFGGFALLSMTGCAMFQASTPKAAGSFCATAGAYMSAISVGGTLAQQTQALQYAATITPACSQSTPAAAESSAVTQAMTGLATLAKPYMTPTAVTGSATS